MQGFTYDVESVMLTDQECADYAALVKELCYPDLQHRVSAWFASVTAQPLDSVCDHVIRQVERAWRLESRM